MTKIRMRYLFYFALSAVVWNQLPLFAQEIDLSSALDLSQLSNSNMNALLTAADPLIGSFDWVQILGAAIFGLIGFVAFVYGKKRSLWRPMVIGIVLMVYPYIFSGRMATYLIGIALTAALYFWKE